MSEEKAQYSPGSQASYEAGGGQLAKNGVVQETEEAEQDWTPEPWVQTFDTIRCDGKYVASTIPPKAEIAGPDAERHIRDAARIVACINALAGVADPAAELALLRQREGLVGRLIEALECVLFFQNTYGMSGFRTGKALTAFAEATALLAEARGEGSDGS